ncbi:MAG TPA: ATP-binding protein [Rubrobacteraceae bacterium]|nr:ATP-binding protein [Rubrobacteraceae bacterium]
MESSDELQKIRIGAGEQLAAIPRVLKELQELVPLLPVAYSTDGRTFGYEAPLSMSIPLGSYVALSAQNGTEYLGQVVTKEVSIRQGAEVGLELDPSLGALLPKGVNLSPSHTYPLQRRYAHGTGVILGRLESDACVPTTGEDGFQSADLSRADEHLIAGYLSASSRATLEIGRALHTDGRLRTRLRADGFDRHTFLCGQSGSGKTFALGVVLERLLLETDLRIIILDPNSDFVRLDRIRSLAEVNRTSSREVSPESYEEISERYRLVVPGLKIVRPAPYAEHPSNLLRIRFSDLERHEQGLVLDMDPLRDREEFNAYRRAIEGLSRDRYSLSQVKEVVVGQFSEEARQLGLRMENLGVADWSLWSGADESSLIDLLAEDWRCLVVDSGTLASPAEQSIVAMALLGHLWRHRHERRPILLVIDEAHNICPQEPSDNLEAAVTSHAIRIAGEGRKFGLYLLVATQRPSKIHANVLSQCDNLVLMKMNSTSDLALISQVFSQAPTSFLDQSPHFAQGECLLAGKIVQTPTFGVFEERYSEEGGTDVPTAWAASRKGGG